MLADIAYDGKKLHIYAIGEHISGSLEEIGILIKDMLRREDDKSGRDERAFQRHTTPGS